MYTASTKGLNDCCKNLYPALLLSMAQCQQIFLFLNDVHDALGQITEVLSTGGLEIGTFCRMQVSFS
jgi:hypothetical protein